MSHNTAHHDDPDYVAIQALLEDIDTQYGKDDGAHAVKQYLNTVVDYELLTHVAQHHVHLVAPRYVGNDLVAATYLPLTRMFLDAFIAGAKMQARRDAGMFTANGVRIPDTPEGL